MAPESCEYDDWPLRRDVAGLEDWCPACADDEDEHLSRCRRCAAAPNLPNEVKDATE